MPAPLKPPKPVVTVLAEMTPEAKRKVAKVFAKHPAWTDVDGARRVDAFRRAARALILGKDGGAEAEASTREQMAALRLCDRIADIFDPVLGGPHAGTNQDDLWRVVAPVFTFDETTETNIEERRARAIVVIDEWAGRFATAGAARASVARGMVAVLAQVSHPLFDRLQSCLPMVEDELGKFKPGTKRGTTPGRGKRTSAGILAHLCVESGAFVEGGGAAEYKPPVDERDRKRMTTDQYDAIRRAIETQFARWAHLKDRT